MFVNSGKKSAVHAYFLSMNQLSVVDVITKYNKNEISPWLQDFYKTVDPNANPLPNV